MKKAFLSFILLIFITTTFSQDLTGTWGGIIQGSAKGTGRNSYIFLEIKQKGRSIWGVYNITDSNNNTIINCLCNVTAMLPKKTSAFIDLYKERVVDYDKKAQILDRCEIFNNFFLHYFLSSDSTEYFTGKASSAVGLNPNAPGTLLVLQKMSNSLYRNVDDYFPKLSKLIEKGETSEKIVFFADQVSSATVTEKRLMQTLKTMLEQNLPLQTKW
ncbi:MAG: hypothetical protein V4557_03830 [Bacteroidota bacterium]